MDGQGAGTAVTPSSSFPMEASHQVPIESIPAAPVMEIGPRGERLPVPRVPDRHVADSWLDIVESEAAAVAAATTASEGGTAAEEKGDGAVDAGSAGKVEAVGDELGLEKWQGGVMRLGEAAMELQKLSGALHGLVAASADEGKLFDGHRVDTASRMSGNQNAVPAAAPGPVLASGGAGIRMTEDEAMGVRLDLKRKVMRSVSAALAADSERLTAVVASETTFFEQVRRLGDSFQINRTGRGGGQSPDDLSVGYTVGSRPYTVKLSKNRDSGSVSLRIDDDDARSTLRVTRVPRGTALPSLARQGQGHPVGLSDVGSKGAGADGAWAGASAGIQRQGVLEAVGDAECVRALTEAKKGKLHAHMFSHMRAEAVSNEAVPLVTVGESHIVLERPDRSAVIISFGLGAATEGSGEMKGGQNADRDIFLLEKIFAWHELRSKSRGQLRGRMRGHRGPLRGGGGRTGSAQNRLSSASGTSPSSVLAMFVEATAHLDARDELLAELGRTTTPIKHRFLPPARDSFESLLRCDLVVASLACCDPQKNDADGHSPPSSFMVISLVGTELSVPRRPGDPSALATITLPIDRLAAFVDRHFAVSPAGLRKKRARDHY